MPFAELFETPLRNGLTKPKAVRGEGMKMVNMGEVFGHRRIHNLDMDRVPMETKERDSSLLRAGDLLFARQSLVLSGAGKCVLFQGDKEDVTFESHIIRCRLDQQKAAPAFYFYLFQSSQGRSLIESIVEQVAAAGIRGTDLGRLVVPVPPLSEQKAIAAVLGALDDKIEMNRRMNATLEAMARALFQSWFVDFDPVRAKIDGRQPEAMAAKTAALFPDALEHMADGSLLPRGWFKTNLGKEVQFQTGFTFKSEFFTDSPPGVRVARGMNVKEGEFFWGSQARYWPEITPELEQYRLQSGDVLIGMDGSKVGKNWVRVRASDLPCLLVQRVARLRPACSIGENFIWIAVGSPTFRYYVDAVKTGTSIPHISGGQIKSFEFVRPPRNDNGIFERFESLVAPMSAQMDKNYAESGILATLRDTLLPKLLSGELSVAEMEEEVSA
jgi:type I restriction enzyme S subunit